MPDGSALLLPALFLVGLLGLRFVLVDHLRDDLVPVSTKTAETVSALAFFALYLLER